MSNSKLSGSTILPGQHSTVGGVMVNETSTSSNVDHHRNLSGTQSYSWINSTEHVHYTSFTQMTFSMTYDYYIRGKKLEPHPIANYFLENWHKSIYIGLLYLLLVYYGTKWMADRPAYNLRYPLAIWSGLLSLFSFMGTIIVAPEFVKVLRNHGFVATYCNSCYSEESSTIYWYTIFSLSKVAELFDTGFIVLRKQKLITLHWVHHMLTLVYVFYIYGFIAATARWMVTMNLIVHTVMYGYYCLRALRIQIPRIIAMSITLGQIIQMIFGLIIHSHIVWNGLTNQSKCDTPFAGATWGLLMYLLYFYFFVKFFLDSYLKSSLGGKLKSSTDGEKKPESLNVNMRNKPEQELFDHSIDKFNVKDENSNIIKHSMKNETKKEL